MRIETWTEPADLHYDRQALSDLTTLRFTDAAAEPSQPHTYRVTAVNTAGLRSEPAVSPQP